MNTTANRWTPEHLAILQEHYADKGAGYVAAQVGRTPRAVWAKAMELGIKNVQSLRNGTPYVRRPKPAEPSLVIAAPKRGPAYSDGPMVFTDKTRRVVCPSMPQPSRTNTHSSY